MSDEIHGETPSSAGIAVPTQPHFIPEPLIDRWLKIPEDECLPLRLKRSDLDNLYFSIQKVVIALSYGWAAIDEVDPVLRKMAKDQSFELSQQSLNHIANFMESIMSSVSEKAGG